MAKPTTKNEDQPMVRHIFPKERMRTNNGPAGEDIERRAYELYLARGRADGYARGLVTGGARTSCKVAIASPHYS